MEKTSREIENSKDRLGTGIMPAGWADRVYDRAKWVKHGESNKWYSIPTFKRAFVYMFKPNYYVPKSKQVVKTQTLQEPKQIVKSTPISVENMVVNN